ncbi:MAG: nicotinate-nucleotide--dimethylbenzimidazole phosphoribosyltransferase [Desulfobacteraceae bacterium]|nr:nicotinate-nucleotide--dimethylbenzimidazole phosphoribosyltransferase [Deltaproteobacteria bacterium]MBL6977298.1 nicotinate-nucleotide--dimethylbenzimidazole phosphoribosyltransferase [Desulfobacteraceae bacterium]MBL7218339.1 nicotinate-nucleotide--dimethylbenzimidazole phosphoribosyltransferase [Desulfobacteraceae bacterium]
MVTKDWGLKEIIEGIGQTDGEWVEKARARTSQLVMPTRALGRLHDISEQLCGIYKTLEPSIDSKAILVMAGDHGVVNEGVSAYPQVITGEMVRAFLRGGAGINVLARQVDAEVWVVDMGIIPELDTASLEKGERLLIRKVAKGTSDFAKGPAMTRQEAEKAILTGFQLATDLFEKGVEILGTGDMGIGNTTPSAAIGTVITGLGIEEMVGRGTGVDDEGLLKKQEAIRQGIAVNQPDLEDGVDILSKIGGFEIGGIAGCVLAGAYHSRPVVLDGFISAAGALVAHAICPAVVDYIFAGHRSEEPGHTAMLRHLGLEPILDLGMRLGEGTGGALAMGIMEGAVRIFQEMLTFEEAGVTDKES